MKLRIVTWIAMIVFSILLQLDVLGFFLKVFVLIVQSVLVVITIYWFFKSDKEPTFESDDILDC